MAQDLLLKLPISEDEYDSSNPELSNKIQSINSSFEQLKSKMQELELEKGITSRKIGEAKKSNQPIDALKERTKALALDIKKIKADILDLRNQATELVKTSVDLPSSPGHFDYSNISDSNPQIEISETNQHDKNLWIDYVANHKHSNAYHLYSFKDVINKSFGHKAIYLIAKDTSNQKVVGVLPAIQINSAIFGNYIVSIPFFNYGGALADNEHIEEQLMSRLIDIGQSLEVSHIEFRDSKHRPGHIQKTEKCSLILKLPNMADLLWQDIGTKVRAQIKKADSHYLEFKTGKDELLDDFYSVFATNMRDLGTPVYAKGFFMNILHEKGIKSQIAIAYKNKKPVSCAFLISHSQTMEIPWASTIRAANTYNANMYLYWNILRTAIESEHGYFDFGRSSKDAGTFKFKTQWGAKPYQLYWHYWLNGQDDLPELNPNNPKYKFAIAVWKRLPVWFTKIIGPYLVKNLP